MAMDLMFPSDILMSPSILSVLQRTREAVVLQIWLGYAAEDLRDSCRLEDKPC